MTDRTNLAGLVESLEDFVTCTPAQHEAARAYVSRNAPDLLDMIFGGAA